MNILIIEDHPGLAHRLKAILSEQGHSIVVRAAHNQLLYQLILSFDPDMVIVSTQSPGEPLLDDIALAYDRSPRPIVMFTEDENDQAIQASVQAGVSAYITGAPEPGRVNTILKVATSRFKANQALHDELKQSRDELANRKIIDRAKGLLMQHRNCDETSAFNALRTMAMNKSTPMVDIAHEVISLLNSRNS